MKKLILVRHAKSDWGDASLPDHNRPLNSRGLKAAPVMGQRLLEKQLIPDLIVSSTAYRAEATAKLIATELKCLDKIVTDTNIYEASVSTLLELIRNLDDAHEMIMLVGHNPGFTMLLNELQDQQFIANMPTCAVAVVAFDVDSWADARTGILLDYDYPKKLPQAEFRA
ncbi:MAG: histidine phosphatase family protein [Thiolinea sp.]